MICCAHVRYFRRSVGGGRRISLFGLRHETSSADEVSLKLNDHSTASEMDCMRNVMPTSHCRCDAIDRLLASASAV